MRHTGLLILCADTKIGDPTACLWLSYNLSVSYPAVAKIRGAVAQSVECVTHGEEVLGSIPAQGLWQPALYCLGRCQYSVTGWDRSYDLLALSRVWQHVKLSDVSLGDRSAIYPSCSWGCEEIDQTNKQTLKPEKNVSLSARHLNLYRDRTNNLKKL